MPHHRHTSTFRFRLQKDAVEKLHADPAMRLMLYCGAEDHLGLYMAGLDIAFPHQVDLKINGQEVKANFRGLKKKPGSTRPVDITSKCQIVENYENSLAMGYALTEKVRVERAWRKVGGPHTDTDAEVPLRYQSGQDPVGGVSRPSAEDALFHQQRECDPGE